MDKIKDSNLSPGLVAAKYAAAWTLFLIGTTRFEAWLMPVSAGDLVLIGLVTVAQVATLLAITATLVLGRTR